MVPPVSVQVSLLPPPTAGWDCTMPMGASGTGATDKVLDVDVEVGYDGDIECTAKELKSCRNFKVMLCFLMSCRNEKHGVHFTTRNF